MQLAQEMALINEEAYGWDSVEAATAYKQVRCSESCYVLCFCVLILLYSNVLHKIWKIVVAFFFALLIEHL